MIDPAALIGTWKFTRDGVPAFIHFSGTQAFDYLQDGNSRQLLRLWYSLEQPAQIRFRNHPHENGWTCTIKTDGNILTITGDELETTCTRAHTHEIPAWFIEQIVNA